MGVQAVRMVPAQLSVWYLGPQAWAGRMGPFCVLGMPESLILASALVGWRRRWVVWV